MTNKSLRLLYQEHQGKVSDKWSLYLSIYDRIFSEFRNEKIRILEIGIQNGGSLEIWAEYFVNAIKLIGCDIDQNCNRLAYEDKRISVVVGDANLDDTEAHILSHCDAYNIIIDDGSHRSSDIVKSFARYFPLLVDGGLFVAEDLHCSYWRQFEGGLYDPYSSISFFKRLADIVNHEHWGVERTRKDLLAGFSVQYGVPFDEEILSHINSVEFINSVCVIRKEAPIDNLSGLRTIVGITELVQSDVKTYNSSEARAIDQSENMWSARARPPDEEFMQRLKDIAERDVHITNLCAQREMLNAELIVLNAERATFGARVGRGITKLRGQVAPVGSTRGSIVRVLSKLVISLHTFGISATSAKIYRAASFRIRSRIVRTRTSLRGVHETGIGRAYDGSHLSAATVQAVQPQLSHWFSKNEPSEQQLTTQKELAHSFSFKPLLSVILPVYKVPRDVLHETIASLELQTYDQWQACIVWSDVDDIAGWDWIQSRCGNDKRFKLKLLSENGGISKNSNSAFEMVEGEFIALLDHDDTITPWAFFEVVKLLQSAPELDFIYSDKDSITADGAIRLNVLFKPEWSPEMLHSVNYLTHLNVMRSSLVREVGGWRPETDGAQDWDLFFRVTEKAKNIVRVPSVLYHWRVLPTSTATGLAAKPYAALGQLRSQQDYFIRRGITCSVVPSPERMFKVVWPVHAASTDVVVFQSGSISQLVAAINALNSTSQASIRRLHVIHSSPANRALKACQAKWGGVAVFTQVASSNWRTALDASLSSDISETVLLLDGRATAVSETLVDELSGWVAQHPDIAWASAIALNSHNVVHEAGRVVSSDFQSAPLFSGSPLFTFGWFGGPLWYRNTRACSPYAVAMRGRDLGKFLKLSEITFGDKDAFVAMCISLTSDGLRGVVDPFARVYFDIPPETQWPNEGDLFRDDPYFNPAFDQVSPLRLKS